MREYCLDPDLWDARFPIGTPVTAMLVDGRQILSQTTSKVIKVAGQYRIGVEAVRPGTLPLAWCVPARLSEF